MKKVNLNKIPSDIENGILSQKEAVNLICSFINFNYPVFGLEKYDEDFREEIILAFLEKGELMISHYDKNQGEFFNYLYCYILSLVHTRLRVLAKKNITDTITIVESINTLEEKKYKYSSISYNTFEIPKVPYSYKTVTPEDLRKTFSNVQGDKKLLVLAIKSAFYINDEQVTKVCSSYNLNENDFYDAIQYCKNLLLSKAERKTKMQERRNHAYYHHKKYEFHLRMINESDNSNNNNILITRINKKNSKQLRSWSKLNKKFEKGFILLRPTNKVVADILGICERQVAYYLSCAKKYLDEDIIF